MLRNSVPILFALGLFLAVPLADAQERDELALPAHAVLSLSEQARVDALRRTLRPELLTPCFAGFVSCGQTVTGRVSVDSCVADGIYGVGYEFTGTVGQSVTIRSSSPSFRMAVALVDGRAGNSTLYAQQQASVIGGTAQISSFTLPYTGPYVIILSPLVPVTFGDYSLTVTCTSAPITGCTENPTTLCLSNSRFRVQGTWQTSDGATGNANVVRLTPDTGYLWFFNSSNVEAVIKVLDACGPFSRFWVFAGGLTNVRVELTVTDTKSGAVKRYTNPLNTAFQPIQDTGAFATCP